MAFTIPRIQLSPEFRAKYLQPQDPEVAASPEVPGGQTHTFSDYAAEQPEPGNFAPRMILPTQGGLAPAPSTPQENAPSNTTGRYSSLERWMPYVEEAARDTGLDRNLLLAVIKRESDGNERIVSPAGAIGLMQLMPGTAGELGVDPYDPYQNILGGARYLKQQLDTFGDLDKALAAYNSGPGNVQKHGGIPPFAETQEYVPAVKGHYAEISGGNMRISAGAGGGSGLSVPKIRLSANFLNKYKPSATAQEPLQAPADLGVAAVQPGTVAAPAEPSSTSVGPKYTGQRGSISPMLGEIATTAGAAAKYAGRALQNIPAPGIEDASVERPINLTSPLAAVAKPAGKVLTAIGEKLDPFDVRMARAKEKMEQLKVEDNKTFEAWQRGDLGFVIDKIIGQYSTAGDYEKAEKARELKKQYMGVVSGKQKAPGRTGGMEGLWLSTIEMLPAMIKTGAKALALTAAGTATGNPLLGAVGTAVSVSEWIMQGTGDSYDLMREAKVEPEIAAAISPLGGALYGFVEVSQFGKITDLAPAVKKGIARKAIRTVLMRVAKEKAIDWTQEVEEEVLQQFVIDVSVEIGKAASGIKDEKLRDKVKRIAGNMAEAFIGSVGQMGVLSALGLAGGTARGAYDIRKEKQNDRLIKKQPTDVGAPPPRIDTAAQPGAEGAVAAGEAAPTQFQVVDEATGKVQTVADASRETAGRPTIPQESPDMIESEEGAPGKSLDQIRAEIAAQPVEPDANELPPGLEQEKPAVKPEAAPSEPSTTKTPAPASPEPAQQPEAPGADVEVTPAVATDNPRLKAFYAKSIVTSHRLGQPSRALKFNETYEVANAKTRRHMITKERRRVKTALAAFEKLGDNNAVNYMNDLDRSLLETMNGMAAEVKDDKKTGTLQKVSDNAWVRHGVQSAETRDIDHAARQLVDDVRVSNDLLRGITKKALTDQQIDQAREAIRSGQVGGPAAEAVRGVFYDAMKWGEFQDLDLVVKGLAKKAGVEVGGQQEALPLQQPETDAPVAAPEESVVAGQKFEAKPTDAQKDAGNYKKGHTSVDGLEISIENPVGSVRSGKDRTGRAWSQTLKSDYGYILGTKGKDKDHVDVFVKPGYAGGATGVVVINQQDPESGAFDEHKVMLGYNNPTEAKKAYLANYEKDWKGLQSIITMPMDQFKEWVKDTEKTRAPVVPPVPAPVESEEEKQQAAVQKQKEAARKLFEKKQAERTRATVEAGLKAETEKRGAPVGKILFVTPDKGKTADAPVKTDAQVAREKRDDALARAKAAALKLAKSFEEPTPGRLNMIGTEQAELAFETVSALVEAGYYTFKEIVAQLRELVGAAADSKGFQGAVEDAWDSYAESGGKVEARGKVTFAEAMGEEKKDVSTSLLDVDAETGKLPDILENGIDWEYAASLGFTRANIEAVQKKLLDTQVRAAEIPETYSIDTPERQELRRKIIDKEYGTGAEKKEKQLWLVLGLPAAGKSANLAEPLAKDNGAILIDSDNYKKSLPEFDGGIGASAVHRESSDIIEKKIFARAVGAGDNIVLPRLGKNINTIRKAMSLAKDSGYSVHLQFVDLAPGKAAVRALTRFIETGRFVDPAMILRLGLTPKNNYGILKLEVDTYAEYSSDVPKGDKIRPVSSSGVAGGLRSGRRGGADDGGGVSGGGREKQEGATVGGDDETPISGNGAGTLGPVSPEDVRGAEKGGETGRGTGQGGDEGDRPDVETGRDDAPERSGGDSSAPLHPASGGRGRPASGRRGTGSGNVGPDGLKNGHTDSHGNYHITDADNIGAGSLREKYRRNVEAIRLLKLIESENRLATPEEQSVLARYVGWGGMKNALDENYHDDWQNEYEELKDLLTPAEYDAAQKSTANAHYTSVDVVRAMWTGLQRLGFNGGAVIEPAVGVGNFFGLRPDGTQLTMRGIEMDSLSGRIAKQLYQGGDIRVSPYEDYDAPQNYHDVALSNVPFSHEIEPYDRNAAKYGMKKKYAIHDFYFLKSLYTVREGGIVAFITSRFTMDKAGKEVRALIAKQANLLGAIRLPNNAFRGNANTDVVTDIIFLQKRAAGTLPDQKTRDFVNTGSIELDRQKGEGKESFTQNKYYIDNPDMVIGTQKTKSSQFGPNDYTVEFKGDDFKEKLAATIGKLPANTYAPRTETAQTEHLVKAFAPENIAEGAFFIDDKGEVKQRGKGGVAEDVLVDVKDRPTKIMRLKMLVDIKSALRGLLYAASVSESDADKPVVDARKKLNDEYDRFYRFYGAINSPYNQKLIEDDNDIGMYLALEKYDRKEKTAKKTDIFKKLHLTKYVRPTKAETPMDALVVSLSENGGANWARMSELTGLSETELQDRLLAEGAIFRDAQAFNNSGSDADFRLADEYLSGNVRIKLKEAEAAAKKDARFNANVAALRPVIPVDLPPGDISMTINNPILKVDDMKDFMADLFGIKADRFDLHKDAAESRWSMNEGGLQYSQTNNETYGAGRLSGADIVLRMLNNKSMRITVTDKETKKTYVDEEATALAKQRQIEIEGKFQTWLWKDDKRAERLLRDYNDLFNAMVVRDFKHPVFMVNKSAEVRPVNYAMSYPLRSHQANALWRVVQNKFNMLAHVVGAGKTLEMICGGMELRRLGLRKKNLYVVPNHMIEQWSRDFRESYPGANILAVSEKMMDAKHRKHAINRIATGDWDAVIVRQSQFKMIPISPEVQIAFFNKKVAAYKEAIGLLEAEETEARGGRRKGGKQSRRVRELAAKLLKYEAKIKELNDMKKDTGVIYFDQLGVDQLFVDEADMYKNVDYFTQMQGVASLGQMSGNETTSDMQVKIDWLRAIGGGVTFATGTPISNTMAEAYHMMKYLQPEDLAAVGMKTFDDWKNVFGRVVENLETNNSGSGFVLRTRFSRFDNVPELLAMMKKVWDIQTAPMLEDAGILVPGKNLPKTKRTYVDSPGYEDLKDYIVHLAEREDRAKQQGKPEKGMDNVLAIIGDGRKAAVDLRLIDPDLPDNPDSKLNRCVDIAYDRWKAGKKESLAGVIFYDLTRPQEKKKTEEEGAAAGPGEVNKFDVQAEIKRKLIARGVPAAEIAFIHDANTDIRKIELFNAVNEGKIRVLIGSTQKMGAGTNIQERLKWLVHLDAPWRPRDVEQREGRIIRQGNTNEDIEIVYMVAKGSYDTALWNILEIKAKSIAQVMAGKNGQREVEDEAGMYTSAKVLSIDDPRIKEAAELDQEIRQLSALQRAYTNQQVTARMELARARETIKFCEEQDVRTKQEIADRGEKPKDFEITVGDKKYDNREKAGAQLLFNALHGHHVVGEYHGYDIHVSYINEFKEFKDGNRVIFVLKKGKIERTTGSLSTESSSGIMQAIEYAVWQAPEKSLSANAAEVAYQRNRLPVLEKTAKTDFPRMDELVKKQSRMKQVQQEIADMAKAAAAAPGMSKIPGYEDYASPGKPREYQMGKDLAREERMEEEAYQFVAAAMAKKPRRDWWTIEEKRHAGMEEEVEGDDDGFMVEEPDGEYVDASAETEYTYVEERKRVIDPNQISLFDNNPEQAVREEIEAAHGSEENASLSHRSVDINGAGSEFESTRAVRSGDGALRSEPANPESPKSQWYDRRRIDYTGTKVSSEKELAELFSVFRHPSLEHFHIVMTKGDLIVGHNMIASGLAGMCHVFQKDDLARALYVFKSRMRRLGADGFYLIHNHPGGNITPSEPDIAATAKYVNSGIGVERFKGHIITDHDQFTTLIIGEVERDKVTAFDSNQKKYSGGEKMYGDETVRSPADIAVLGFSHTSRDDHTAIVVMNPQMRVMGVVPVRGKVSVELVNQEIMAHGGTRAGVATSDRAVFASLSADVAKKRASANPSERILDVVFLPGRKGGGIQSAVAEGRMPSEKEEKTGYRQWAENKPNKGFVWEPDAPEYQSSAEKAKALETAIRSIRAKMRLLPEDNLLARARLELDIANYKADKLEIIKGAIYDYAKNIGLRGVPYNTVDTMLKNASTAAQLKKAVVRIDEIWEKFQKSKARKQLLDMVEMEYRRLRGIEGKRISTTELESNRMLKGYLDELMDDGSKGAEERMRRVMAFMNSYAKESIKENDDALGHLSDSWREWVEDPSKAVPKTVAHDIQALFRKNVSVMSTDQMKRTMAEILEIKRYGRTLRMVEKQKDDLAMNEAAGQVAAEVRAATKGEPESQLHKALKRRDTDLETRLKRARRGFWALIDPERIAQSMVGWKASSIIRKYVTQPIYDAEGNKLRGLKAALSTFQQIHQDIDIAAARGKPMFAWDVAGHDTEMLNLSQMMFIYANSKNRSNRNHLAGTLGLPDEYADEAIQKVIDALPQNAKNAVDHMIEYYDNVQYQRINPVFAEEHQVDMPRESNYFPIQNLKTDIAESAVTADILAHFGAGRAAPQKGMTRSRVESKAAFKSMDYFDVVGRNLSATEHYIAYQGAVQKIDRFLKNRELRAAMEEKSEDRYNLLKDWLRAVAVGKIDNRANDPVSRFLDTSRKHFTTFILGLKLPTVLMQAASLPKGIAGVDKKLAARASYDFMKNPASVLKMVNELSPWMENRSKTFEHEIAEWAESDAAKNMLGGRNMAESAYKGARDVAMWTMGAVDKGVATIVWLSHFYAAQKAGKEEADAIRAGDEAVRKTQSRGGVVLSPAIYRTNGFTRALMMFSSDLNQNLNMLVEYVGTYKDKTLTQKIVEPIFFAIIPTLIIGFVQTAFRRPDERPEDYASEFLGQVFGAFPLWGQVAQAFSQYMLDSAKELRGVKPDRTWKMFAGQFDVSPLQVFEDLVSIDPTNALSKTSIKAATRAAGAASGLPLHQPLRMVDQYKDFQRTGDWRYLFFGRGQMRDQSVEGSMVRRAIGPATAKDKMMLSEYMKGLDKEKRAAFIRQVQETKQEKSLEAFRRKMVQYRQALAEMRKTGEITTDEYRQRVSELNKAYQQAAQSLKE